MLFMKAGAHNDEVGAHKYVLHDKDYNDSKGCTPVSMVAAGSPLPVHFPSSPTTPPQLPLGSCSLVLDGSDLDTMEECRRRPCE